MKRFLAISLIFVLMYSNMGITLATHYCGGRIAKTTFVLGNSTIDCGMLEMNNSCEPSSKGSIIKKKNCCDNERVSIETEEIIQPSLLNSSIDHKFVFTFVYTFIRLLNSDTTLDLAYGDYSPPLRNRDAQVLFQSFLI